MRVGKEVSSAVALTPDGFDGSEPTTIAGEAGLTWAASHFGRA